MRIGSLVICINDNPLKTDMSRQMKKYGYAFPTKNEMYVIRGFQDEDGSNLLLDEIVNRKMTVRYMDTQRIAVLELGFGNDRFVEIQPPMDLSELLTNSIPEDERSVAIPAQ